MQTMNFLSTEHLSAAGSHAMVDNGDLLGAHTAQERHSEISEERPSLLLRPRRKKSLVPSFIHLAAILASLGAVYVLLRCFKKTTLGHGQGAVLRSLANEGEDECARIPHSDGGLGEDGFHWWPAFLRSSAILAPLEPEYGGAHWGAEMLPRAEEAGGMYTGAVGELEEETVLMSEGTITTGFEGIPSVPSLPAYYVDASWGAGMLPAVGETEAQKIGPVGGIPGAQLMWVGAQDWPSSGSGKSGRHNGSGPQRSGTLRDAASGRGLWRNREVANDTKAQMEKMITNICFFSNLCQSIQPYIGKCQMLRLTAALMNVLVAQLAVHSLTSPSMEPLRAQAGNALLNLANRALGLANGAPGLDEYRSSLEKLIVFTKAAMLPRPLDKEFSDQKFKSKILGMLGFSVVVHWYLMGIMLGLQYELNISGGTLDDAFVGRCINLLEILQTHQVDRIVVDSGARWFLERCQIETCMRLFFSRIRIMQSTRVPIISSAEFSRRLRRAVENAGGLPYTSTQYLKHVNPVKGGSTHAGHSRHGMLFTVVPQDGRQTGMPSSASGAGKKGMAVASLSPVPGEENSLSLLVARDATDVGLAGSSSRSSHSTATQSHSPIFPSGHSPTVMLQQRPKQHAPHLPATPETAGGPYPQQQHQPFRPTPGPWTKSGISVWSYQAVASMQPWGTSPRKSFPVVPPSDSFEEAAQLLQTSEGGLLVRPSAPWGHTTNAQEETTLLQGNWQAPAAPSLGLRQRTDSAPSADLSNIPFDELSAMYASPSTRQHSAESPGASPREPQVFIGPEGWAHSPPRTSQPLQSPLGLWNPFGDNTHRQSGAAHSRPAPGSEGHGEARTSLTLLTEEMGSISPYSSSQLFPPVPYLFAVQQYSPPARQDPFGGTSKKFSPQSGGSAPDFPQQQPNALPDTSPEFSEQGGISIGIRVGRHVSESSSSMPQFSPPSTDSLGMQWDMKDVERTLLALIEGDESSEEG